MHLIENYYKDWKPALGESVILPKRLSIQENMRITEGEKTFDVYSKYEVPVWRLDKKNLNGRTYSEGLARKVIKENKITNSLGNHPPEQSEGSVFDIVAVTRNPHIREGILYVDCYFVDKEFQEKVDKIIEYGSTIGLSSSAYGDLDGMGNVMEEGFTVERYLDFVLNPSYEVYLDSNSKAERKESLVSPKPITNNNVDLKQESNKKSIKEKHIMAMTIEEKNFQLGVKKLLTEAKVKTNLSEKLAGYETVLEYCDGIEFATPQIEEAVKEINLLKKEMGELAEKGKTAPALEETVKVKEKEAVGLSEKNKTLEREINEIQEKYDISCQFLDDMKNREKKIKEMYELTLAEKNGMVNPTDYKELSVYTESLEKEMEKMKKENSKLKRRVTAIVEAAAKKGMKITIKEADEKKDDDDDEEKKDKKEMKEEEDKKEKEDEKDEKKKDMKEAEKKDKDDEAREKEDKEDEEEAKKKMKEAEDKKAEEDEEEEEMEEDLDIRNNPLVRNYYNECVSENPNVKKIKADILSCKTLSEAQKVHLNLLDLVEEGHSTSGLIGEELHESTRREAAPTGRALRRPGWL